jgi:hypothetical protein
MKLKLIYVTDLTYRIKIIQNILLTQANRKWHIPDVLLKNTARPPFKASPAFLLGYLCTKKAWPHVRAYTVYSYSKV